MRDSLRGAIPGVVCEAPMAASDAPSAFKFNSRRGFGGGDHSRFSGRRCSHRVPSTIDDVPLHGWISSPRWMDDVSLQSAVVRMIGLNGRTDGLMDG